ncbi:MAG: iron ABC transporter permease [Euryarchaeota archaeon]|nr:iron ABC transporter permease [Euryarchaeota archaeon]
MPRNSEVVGRGFVVISYVMLSTLPFVYAMARLQSVTSQTPLEALLNFPEAYGAIDALWFTLLEASASAILTVLFGLPIAWYLGRYQWKHATLLRAVFSVPFVMPAIVVAMGFLLLIDQQSLLFKAGLDLRTETGVIGAYAQRTGWSHPGHFLALIIAHAWFNLSLIIRFVEPTVARLDPAWEEQMSLLGQGQSTFGRLRHLWWPVLGPAVLCAASLSFLFSFTSFALVKWLAPFNHTLESLMASYGGSAGIANYRVDTSEIVMSASIVQFLILLGALYLTSTLQRRHSNRFALVSEHGAQASRGPPTFKAKITVYAGFVFALAPMIAASTASFRIRNTTDTGTRYTWGMEAWDAALAGNLSTLSVTEALANSMIFAIGTLIIALPVGWVLASTIHALETSNHHRFAKALDVATLLPLAISAIMVGLGVLLGVLKSMPSLFQWSLLPILPHVILTVPFVVRIMLPAMRSVDPKWKEQATVLGLNPLRTWYHGYFSFIRGPAVVASSLTLAFSLGEFGASWLLVRTGSWDTLSVLVDALMSRPKFDPLVQPTAMAAATVLMMLTFFLFILAERFRAEGEGGGF